MLPKKMNDPEIQTSPNMSNPVNNGYITVENKNNINFLTNLANMTAADCRHDFGINVSTKGIDKQFSDALPASVTQSPDEDGVLDSIITTTQAIPSFRLFLDSITKDDSNGKDFDVRYPNSGQSYVTTYNVFRYDGDNYRKSGFNFGSDFAQKSNLFLQTNNAAIVVDFNQHGFISKLKEGTKVDGTIHYLMTPEVVNDPAGKPSIFDKTVFNFDSGVKMISYVQTTPTTTEYTPFNKNSTEFSNNFFSNYNFSLSPIQQTFEKGNISKLNTSLTISYNDGSKPYINTITDSKKQNSINSLTGYVMSLINKLGEPLDKFNFNSKLQQKRGGDWFQALCCLSVNNKTYSSLLPDASRKVDFSGPVYLVTHDRIALGYALVNGVNVIYLANNKDTYVFKNRNDTIVKANSVPIEQSIHKELTKFITKEPNADLSDYKDFQLKYDVYNKSRMFILSKCQEEFQAAITSATTFLNNPKLLSSDYRDYSVNFKQLLSNIKSIFKKASLYSFILQKLPDIDDKYKFIEDFLGTDGEKFPLEFDDSLGSNLLKIREYKSFITDSAFEQLGPGGISRNYEGQSANSIKQLLSNALDKMDIVIAIDTLFSSQQKGITDSISSFLERIKNVGSKTQPQVYEQYIFLKFITNMPLEQISLIVDIFEQKLIPIITNYGKNLETYYNGRRTKASDEEKSMFFRPANFSSEVILILKPFYKSADTCSVPFNNETIGFEGDSSKQPILNESTDNVLIVTDSISRNINANAKESNALDFNEQMGGSEGVFSNKGGAIGIVCDSNINTIIWDLMGRKMNNDAYFHNVLNYINFMSNNISIQANNVDSFITQFLQSNYADEGIKNNISQLMDRKGQFDNCVSNNQIQNIILLTIFLLVSSKKSELSGGGSDDISIALKEVDNQIVLRDALFCYHPLLPIYINLTSFYQQIGPDFNGDPFYDTYIKYVNVLEKMADILISNYLSNDVHKNMEAYFIGYSLKTIFFTSNKNNELFLTLKSLLKLDDNESRLFAMKNDIFGGQIVGNNVINDGDVDEIIGKMLMTTPLVSNFINNEVNVSQIVLSELNQEQIPVDDANDSLAYTSKLKLQINNILDKIVNKISVDRTGNPPDLSIPEGNYVSMDISDESSFEKTLPTIKGAPVAKGIEPWAQSKSNKRRRDEFDLRDAQTQSSYKKYKPIQMRTGFNNYSQTKDVNPMGFDWGSFGQEQMAFGGTKKYNRKRKFTKRHKKLNKKRSIRKRKINKRKRTNKRKNK